MDSQLWPENGSPAIGESGKIAAIRNELPATQRFVYFNAGTNGPLPRRTHEALVASSQAELEQGRIGMESFTRLFQNLTDARAAMAGVLGCSDAEIALTHNTTEGMNIALMGLDWQPGDEVVTVEDRASRRPLPALRAAPALRREDPITEIGLPDRDPLEELRRVLDAAHARRWCSRTSAGPRAWCCRCARWRRWRTASARC